MNKGEVGAVPVVWGHTYDMVLVIVFVKYVGELENGRLTMTRLHGSLGLEYVLPQWWLGIGVLGLTLGSRGTGGHYYTLGLSTSRRPLANVS